jgi:hypothetical protein
MMSAAEICSSLAAATAGAVAVFFDWPDLGVG